MCVCVCVWQANVDERELRMRQRITHTMPADTAEKILWFLFRCFGSLFGCGLSSSEWVKDESVVSLPAASICLPLLRLSSRNVRVCECRDSVAGFCRVVMVDALFRFPLSGNTSAASKPAGRPPSQQQRHATKAPRVARALACLTASAYRIGSRRNRSSARGGGGGGIQTNMQGGSGGGGHRRNDTDNPFR